MGLIKSACAQVNFDLRPARREAKLKLIQQAAQEVIDGKLDHAVRRRHLPDRLRHLDQHEHQRGDRQPGQRNRHRQARRQGAGPSQRSRQHGAKLQRRDPHRHARRRPPSRSRSRWCPALEHLADALEAKAKQYDDVVKIGRTHLQDATPDPARAGARRLRRPGPAVGPAGREGDPAPARAAAGRDRRRHRHQLPPRFRQSTPSRSSPRRPASNSSRRRTISKPRPPRTASSKPAGCSRPSPSASPRSPTTSAGWPAARAAASARSPSPPPSPAARSCPARSTR